MTPLIDLSLNVARHKALHNRSCYVACSACPWKGRRKLRFLLDLGQHIDLGAALGYVKGLVSTTPCPRCQGQVRFTKP